MPASVIREEMKKVEKVDALIEVLAEHISEAITCEKERDREISEMTMALAVLILARAIERHVVQQ